MKPPDWIVCEREPHWAPALRVALSRRPFPSGRRPAVREVRRLERLAELLPSTEECLFAIEVSRDVLKLSLRQIPRLLDEYPLSRGVAFLARSLVDTGAAEPASGEATAKAILALCEAGVSDVATSPRKLDGILDIGQRFAEQAAAGATARRERMPIFQRVRSTLPWQPSGSPLG